MFIRGVQCLLILLNVLKDEAHVLLLTHVATMSDLLANKKSRS